jgi:hypothetical protein
MKTSKFVLVTPDYPPARGGVARYLGNLVSVSGGEIRVIVSERHPTEGPGEISHAKFVGKGWPAWAPLIRVFRSIADEIALVSHVFPFGTAAWIARKIRRGGVRDPSYTGSTFDWRGEIPGSDGLFRANLWIVRNRSSRTATRQRRMPND